MPEFLNVGLFHRNDAANRVERPSAIGRVSPSSPERHGRTENRDLVELSEHARHLAGLRNMPPVRSEKIEAAQAMIAAGGYDNPDMLSIAVGRMVEEDLA